MKCIPDDNALILPVAIHVGIAVVADGKYVGRKFADLAVLVQLYLLGCVDRQDLVGVHGDQDRAGVCLRITNHKIAHSNINRIIN